jgi:hypothetical protein
MIRVMVLTLTQAANGVPRLILLVSETLGRAEIGGLSAWECGRRLGISGDDQDHAELGAHVVYITDAEPTQVELVELAGLGKPFDSYAHTRPQVFTFLSASRYG